MGFVRFSQLFVEPTPVQGLLFGELVAAEANKELQRAIVATRIDCSRIVINEGTVR